MSNLLNKIFHKRTMSPNMAVQLTPIGVEKADKMEGEGGRFLILGTLRENGNVATIHELKEQTHLSQEQIEMVVRSIIKSGYARPARSGDSG